MQSSLLVSATVVQALALGPTYQVGALGALALRGKQLSVELYDVQLVDNRR